MKALTLLRSESPRIALPPRTARARPTSRLRFGEELVHFGEEPAMTELVQQAQRLAVPHEVRPVVFERDELHLVVQKGRLFQRSRPEVPVILDRGRFLLVKLDPREVARVAPSEANARSKSTRSSRRTALPGRPGRPGRADLRVGHFPAFA
jgi:hypothetical protein